MLNKIKEKYIHKLLWGLTKKYPNRTRTIKVNGKPYLTRFYLTPRRLNEQGNETGDYNGYGIYLHYFHTGDEDRELHNHPWEKALSYIICGGYKEERRNNKTNLVEIKNINPGTFNFIKNNDFHRVILKANVKHIWTLFITGKRVQDWGFWNRETGKYISHKEFVEKEDQGYILNENNNIK